MKIKIVAFALLCLALPVARAQNVVVSYQGRVTAGGAPFSGLGQFKFALVTSSNQSRTATASATITGSFVTSINVTDGGNGYVSPPAVTLSGGGGSGATATANVSGGRVTSITVNNAGSGYTAPPAVSVAPPPDDIHYTTYWSNDGTSLDGSEPSAAVGVNVVNGLFNALLGDATLTGMTALNAALFAQPNLQLRVWFSDGSSGFVALSPLQRLTYTPYAAFTQSASNLLGALPVEQLAGTLPFSKLPGGLVTNNQSGVNFAGSFSGNATGLTNLPVGALALTTTNSVLVGWGRNEYGQATAPRGLINVLKAAVGRYHTVALKGDGTVVAWGNNVFGQTNVPAGLNNVIAVAARGYYSLALKNNGTVVAWGNNASGQTNVPAGLNNVIAVAAGQFHSLALKNDGTVVAWGDNGSGQTNVPAGLNNVIAVAAGGYYSLALKNDGTVIAWGNNGNGQTNVPAGLNNVIAVAGGEYHSLALKNDGTVVAWGDNGNGQTNVPPGLNGVFALAQGGLAFHAMVLRRQPYSPVAWLGMDNTFEGNVTFNGVIMGKVGINVVPQQPLHVNVGYGQGEGMEIDSSISGHSPAIYLNHTGNNGHNFRLASFGDNSNPGSFVIRDDTAGADRLTIDGSGGVRAEIGSGSKFSLSGNGAFEIDAPGIVGGRFTVTDAGKVGIGVAAPSEKLHVSGNILATGTITPNSDRNAKTAMAPVDPVAILNRLTEVPIQQWRFKTEAEGVRHVGPMAQDFHAAFGLGERATAIATVDADGVAMAAIQGLNQKIEALKATLDRREEENAQLRRRLESLEKILLPPEKK